MPRAVSEAAVHVGQKARQANAVALVFDPPAISVQPRRKEFAQFLVYFNAVLFLNASSRVSSIFATQSGLAKDNLSFTT